MEELNRVLSLIHPDWTTSYYKSLLLFKNSSLRADVISLAVYHGLAFYLQHQIGTNGKGIIQKAREARPLLFCSCDGFDFIERTDNGLALSLVTSEILLNNGADPMESFEIYTPWSYLVVHLKPQFRSVAPNFFRLTLERGADPTERVSINANDYEDWSEAIQKKQYTTTFHMLLEFLRHWSDENETVVKLLVDRCNDLEATDSDGITIQNWADKDGPFPTTRDRSKNNRQRRRKH